MEHSISQLCDDLTNDLKNAYEQSTTMQDAEKLAAKFLHAQMIIARELTLVDLSARMKKAGSKSIRGAVYMEHATKGDKKPSDVFIQAEVDQDQRVKLNQGEQDSAEVEAEALQNYLNIFREAHVYYRGIAKGTYSG